MKIDRILFFVVVLFLTHSSKSQSWEFVKHVTLSNIDNFLLDHQGNIFVSQLDGELIKFSATGDELLNYSSSRRARIQELNSNTVFQISLFYKDLQEYVVLNRYLGSPITYRMSDYEVGYIEDIAPNAQLNVWLMDLSEFSLKLLDVSQNLIIENKSLAQVLNQYEYEVYSFHNHQNRLYLVGQYCGIQIFDNIGNYLYKLDETSPNQIGFEKDYLYYQYDDKLIFRHLYQGDDYQIELPKMKFEKVVYKNNRLIGFSKDGLDIYNYLSCD